MQIFTLILILLAGIICLYIGAELLIIYAARLAISLGMTPLVVGLTVVAFSTSTPELSSTLTALIKGDHTNMVVGAIVGSNIANIGLILGLISMIKPLDIKRSIKTFETPFNLFLTLLLWVFMLNGVITRWMGIVLIIGIHLYVLKHVLNSRKHPKEEEQPIAGAESISKKKRAWYFVLILVGVIVLGIGGTLLIRGAVSLAQLFGVSDRIIGLSVVALGTSLPEFAASFVAIIRKLGDVAVGNILGSNVFNVLFILGIVSIVKPLTFSPQFVSQDVPILFAITLLLWVLIGLQKRLGRLSGLILFGSYVGYLFIVT